MTCKDVLLQKLLSDDLAYLQNEIFLIGHVFPSFFLQYIKQLMFFLKYLFNLLSKKWEIFVAMLDKEVI